MGYYIYKYVCNDVIEYIGKTTDLDRRIKQHQTDKLKNFKGQIYYFECQNKTAMNSWEYCLINKYHPRYNIALKNQDTNINIDEPKWRLYMSIANTNTNSNIINIADYMKKNVQPIKTTPIKTTSSQPATIITHGDVPGQTYINFHCKNCNTSFKTINWYVTGGGNRGAYCPCCHYAAWLKR